MSTSATDHIGQRSETSNLLRVIFFFTQQLKFTSVSIVIKPQCNYQFTHLFILTGSLEKNKFGVKSGVNSGLNLIWTN